MTNVILFPNGRAARTADVERRSEFQILFFTGVRYVRDEASGDGLPPLAALPADQPGAAPHGMGEAVLEAAERLQA